MVMLKSSVTVLPRWSRTVKRTAVVPLTTARNCEKGCELAVGERPDIIIMDLEMPVMDGWEAARWLKREPQTRDIPIVALSAHALVGEREKAFAAGCDAFDAKPIQFERLLATLRRLGQAAGDGGGRS
jgi:two-component system cell cycle response regulator DivK